MFRYVYMRRHPLADTDLCGDHGRGIVPDPAVKAVISFAGIAAAVIATTSSAAVVIHLKKINEDI